MVGTGAVGAAQRCKTARMVAGAADGTGPRLPPEARLDAVEAGLNVLLKNLSEYEKQQTSWKADLEKAVQAEFGKVGAGLTELHGKVQALIAEHHNKLSAETRGGKQRCLLEPKDMKPTILTKEDDWRTWKAKIEDYAEEVHQGMKQFLERAEKANDAIDDLWFRKEDEDWWKLSSTFYRMLKNDTGTEAQRVVR